MFLLLIMVELLFFSFLLSLFFILFYFFVAVLEYWGLNSGPCQAGALPLEPFCQLEFVF
jgi:hypothetical protein